MSPDWDGGTARISAGQKRQREVTKPALTIRQEAFILRTIYRMPGEDFATKPKLSAGYRTDPRRDYLAKHEDGGEKVAIQGKPYVAVPLPDLKLSKKGLVPKRLFPNPGPTRGRLPTARSDPSSSRRRPAIACSSNDSEAREGSRG